MQSVVDKLDHEWESLARSDFAIRTLHKWAQRHAVFHGLPDLSAVLELRRSPDHADDVMSALATLAPADDLAARTLLQAMIPGLVALTRIDGHRHGVLDELVSRAWMDIRARHPRRDGSVAGNILLAVRKRYLQDRCKQDEPLSELTDTVRYSDEAPPAEDVALGNLGLGLLLQRLRRAQVPEEMIEALVRTRVDGETVASVSADIGVAPQCLTVRLRRIEQRLSRLALAG